MTKQIPKSMFTTPQAAETIGVAESTVRSWLSRRTDFVEGHHYIKEENGRTLWTEAGIQFLKTSSKEFPKEISEGDFSADEIIDPLLEATATKLAHSFFKKLPQRTVERIREMLSNPSDEDREILQQSVQQSIEAGATHLIANATTRRLVG